MVTATRNNPVADIIAMVVVILMAIGTVFVFSASANIGQELDLQRLYDYPSLRQILFFPLACSIMYIVSCFNYRKLSFAGGWLRNPTIYLLVLSVALLAVVLLQRFYPVFPRFVPKINQHYRWLKIPLGPIAVSFQPSELAKWAIVFFLAAVCDKFRDDIKLYWKRFLPICSVVGVVVALVIVEDFGTAAFISLLAFLMLIIAGARWWHVLTPLPFGAAAFFFMLIRSPGRMRRIAAFLSPEKWTDSASYQANQSLIALGSGGVWG
ncbi:MAG: FtsW/RodA/SpoVE family cell cycle protein, partial [Phycisphaerales bacterium]